MSFIPTYFDKLDFDRLSHSKQSNKLSLDEWEKKNGVAEHKRRESFLIFSAGFILGIIFTELFKYLFL